MPNGTLGSVTSLGSGYWLTNKHVVQEMKRASVANRKWFPASVVAVSNTSDLALIKCDLGYASTAIATEDPRPGTRIKITGYAHGNAYTRLTGVIGNSPSSVQGLNGQIKRGMSGGAVRNRSGELIGIVSQYRYNGGVIVTSEEINLFLISSGVFKSPDEVILGEPDKPIKPDTPIVTNPVDGQIESRLDQVEVSLAYLETSVKRLNQSVTVLNQSVTSINSTITNIDGGGVGQDQMTNVQSELAALKKRLESLEGLRRNLLKRFGHLLATMETMESGRGPKGARGPRGKVDIIITDGKGREFSRYENTQSGSKVLVNINRFTKEEN
jgi:S1-C subfamily serine protease